MTTVPGTGGRGCEGGLVSADLLTRARAGDGEAFGELVEPYRRELQVHCYRFLASAQDAEDAVQETLLAAWRGLGGFEGRASVRTWLFRVATSRCLHALRSASRRPPMSWPDLVLPKPSRAGEVAWLEPYPDVLLDGLADFAPGPEARYEAREAISLAFVTALQLLPPRQRAVLILRDVLGFRAAEVASMLDTTQESVTSALKRARATLARQPAPSAGHQAPPPPGSAPEQQLAARLARAFEASDVQGIVCLLTHDAWIRMPPLPMEYQGRELAARFFAWAFHNGHGFRLIPTRANGQPAFGLYLRDPHAAIARANGLLVLTLAGPQISAITRFEPGVLTQFGLPRTLPD
jgi:RNA polymerase sigma-70 factor (TIGR02960 family)